MTVADRLVRSSMLHFKCSQQALCKSLLCLQLCSDLVQGHCCCLAPSCPSHMLLSGLAWVCQSKLHLQSCKQHLKQDAVQEEACQKGKQVSFLSSKLQPWLPTGLARPVAMVLNGLLDEGLRHRFLPGIPTLAA